MADSILLPVNGGDGSAAAEYAIAVARATGATVRVLAVADPSALERVPADETASLRARADERSRAALESTAGTVDAAGIDVVRDHREGVPHQEITTVADDSEIDLLVMEADGRTAERVLSLSDVPVLVVPPDARGWLDAESVGPSRIVIPTDGSDAAARAADCALELATNARGAVDVISVIDETNPALADAPPHLIELCREGGHDAIEPIAVAARDRGLPVTTDVIRGVPHEEIVSYAAAVGADLIAMGARGLAIGDEPLLGGTTAHVLARTDRPVLAVR